GPKAAVNQPFWLKHTIPTSLRPTTRFSCLPRTACRPCTPPGHRWTRFEKCNAEPAAYASRRERTRSHWSNRVRADGCLRGPGDGLEVARHDVGPLRGEQEPVADAGSF